MRHVFKATKIGWDEEQEGVWFDSDFYSKEEAEAEFKPYQGTTRLPIYWLRIRWRAISRCDLYGRIRR